MRQNDDIQGLLEGVTLTAAPFIVTVYGDVVLPRGEVLSMASLIELCGQAGLNETLVRTAVSRLVKAGRLEGERSGRHSFYRLTPAARAEFAEAADLLYRSHFTTQKWLVVLLPGASEEAVRRFRLGRLSGDAWLCPDRDGVPSGAEMVLSVTAGDAASLRRLGSCWDLSAVEEGYRGVVERFAGLMTRHRKGRKLAPRDALLARILLVHAFRAPLLRDPCLPPSALAPGWTGTAARKLFCELYLALSPDADRHIANALQGEVGMLEARTPDTVARLGAMR
jgi:phenylacetic acid degradation operon negative regulatory protein